MTLSSWGALSVLGPGFPCLPDWPEIMWFSDLTFPPIPTEIVPVGGPHADPSQPDRSISSGFECCTKQRPTTVGGISIVHFRWTVGAYAARAPECGFRLPIHTPPPQANLHVVWRQPFSCPCSRFLWLWWFLSPQRRIWRAVGLPQIPLRCSCLAPKNTFEGGHTPWFCPCDTEHIGMTPPYLVLLEYHSWFTFGCASIWFKWFNLMIVVKIDIVFFMRFCSFFLNLLHYIVKANIQPLPTRTLGCNFN